MKHSNKQLISLVFGASALVMAFSYVSIANASEITPSKVIELVNQDRVSQGFQPLQVNDALTQAAQDKADNMMKDGYFAHTSPTGITPWYWIQKSGYDYRFAGENLAIHFTDAEGQEKAWMASIKHRDNILSPKYQDIGVAIGNTVQNGQTTIIAVQMFGLPSGIVLSATASNPDLATHKVVGNVIVSPVTAVQHNSVSETPLYNQPVHTSERVHLWIQWFGFLLVIMIVAIGVLIILINQRMLYYKWFHNSGSLIHIKVSQDL
jgi:hypothetical protein